MRYPASKRPGTIVPLLAVTVIGIFALVALATDIGLVALARGNLQTAADTAAMTAVRVLTGDAATNNNYAAAGPAAVAVATANKYVGQPITSSMVTTTIGYYAYNSTLQRFEADLSGSKPASESWSAVRVDISANQPTFFARILGFNSMPASAYAVAVHRPRDIAIVLDFSGSMRFSSLNAYPYTGNKTGSLNPDPAFPKFGHWTAMSSVMQRTTTYVDGSGQVFAPGNLTVETANGAAIVNDFLMRDASGNLVNAFVQSVSPYNPLTWAVPAPADWDVQADTTEVYGGASGKGGDLWPHWSLSLTTGNYAATVQEWIAGNNNTQSDSHSKSTTAVGPGGEPFDPVLPNAPTVNEGYGPNFKGYSIGPGWYGKTFYLWPPDPRWTGGADPTSPDSANPAKDTGGRWMADWRKRFFYNYGTTTPLGGNGTGATDDNRADNSKLWDNTNGLWREAGTSSSYSINYNAIIKWIKSGPKVFPDNLRAGRVLYYTAIPDTIPNSGGDADQRFWRGYINYVIGTGDPGDNNDPYNPRRGLYGRHGSAWGTMKVTPEVFLNQDAATRPYMHYNDNPIRPRLHFWFGPLTMLDFISRYNNNWVPGTCHESQCWQLKAGIQAALKDIEKNHPNDWVSLMFFSNESDFYQARVKLGRDYVRLRNALFFPFNKLDDLSDPNAEIRPYQNNDSLTWDNPGNIPSATGGTAPEMGFKVAYNELSSGTGYYGRRGSAKVVIFETDGVPNHTAAGAFTYGGAYNSYYNVTGGTSSYGNNHPTVLAATLDAVQTICNLDTHATKPGYSTPRLPARVHAIGFGDLFQTTSTSKDDALDFLLEVQKKGSTSASGATSIESYKIITGDYTTRISNLREALERIMQSGVQVSLIK